MANITLSWNAAPASDNVTAFQVWGANGTGTAFGSCTLLATVSGLTWTDTGLPNNQARTYYIVAVNQIGSSSPEGPINVTTAAPASTYVQNAGGATTIQEGTHTARPAAGNAGAIYVETDTGSIFRDDGSAWDQIGGGALTVEDEGSPLGSAATINFTGAGVTASVSGGVATVNVPGGSTSGLGFPFVQETSAASGSNTTSFTVTFPQATAASGNTAFMIVATDGSQTIGTPSGWTVDINQVGTTYARFMVLHRATAGNTSATFTSTTNTSYAVFFFELSGSHAVDQSSTGNTTNASIVALPSFTPTNAAMMFGFAAEVASGSGGSQTPAAPALSPMWNTVSIGGTSAQQRLLFGHVSLFSATGAAVKPPSINNQGQGLFTSGGIAYASFSIL